MSHPVMITSTVSFWASCNESPCHDHKYSFLLGFIQWVTLSIICIIDHHAMNHPVMITSTVFFLASYNESPCHDHKYSILLGFIQWVTLFNHMYHRVSWTETPCHDHVYCITGLNGLSPVHHTVCITRLRALSFPVLCMYHWASWTESCPSYCMYHWSPWSESCPSYCMCHWASCTKSTRPTQVTGLHGLSPVHHTVCVTGLRALSPPVQRIYHWTSWTVNSKTVTVKTESPCYDHTYSIIRFHALGHRSPCKIIQKGCMYLVTLLWSHVQCTVS